MKTCESCGKQFECGAQSNKACWCLDLPVVVTDPKFSDCLCPVCLKQKSALTENSDYYLNENGLMVFTKAYHLKRGYCCKSGCINCPYGFTT